MPTSGATSILENNKLLGEKAGFFGQIAERCGSEGWHIDVRAGNVSLSDTNVKSAAMDSLT